QLFTDLLLHPGVGEIPLPCRLDGDELDDAKLCRSSAIAHGNDGSKLPGSQFQDAFPSGGVCLFLGRLRYDSQVPSVRRRRAVLRISHGQRGKILSRLEMAENSLNLLARLSLVTRLGTGAGNWIGHTRDQNVRQVVTRFDEIKFGLVLVVVI